jgi:hypothetical protein
MHTTQVAWGNGLLVRVKTGHGDLTVPGQKYHYTSVHSGLLPIQPSPLTPLPPALPPRPSAYCHVVSLLFLLLCFRLCLCLPRYDGTKLSLPVPS